MPVSDIIELEMVPQGDSKSKDLNFRWKVKKFTEQHMDIDIEFEKPLYVSATNDERDKLKVTIKSS